MAEINASRRILKPNGNGEPASSTGSIKDAVKLLRQQAAPAKSPTPPVQAHPEPEKLKVVIRLLPPEIKEKAVLDLLSPWVNINTCNYIYFSEGHVSKKGTKDPLPSTAYAGFKNAGLLKTFIREFRTLDIQGKLPELGPNVAIEYAPYQKGLRPSKPDPLAGTLEDDPVYKSFVQRLSDPTVVQVPLIAEEERSKNESKNKGKNKAVAKPSPGSLPKSADKNKKRGENSQSVENSREAVKSKTNSLTPTELAAQLTSVPSAGPQSSKKSSSAKASTQPIGEIANSGEKGSKGSGASSESKSKRGKAKGPKNVLTQNTAAKEETGIPTGPKSQATKKKGKAKVVNGDSAPKETSSQNKNASSDNVAPAVPTDPKQKSVRKPAKSKKHSNAENVSPGPAEPSSSANATGDSTSTTKPKKAHPPRRPAKSKPAADGESPKARPPPRKRDQNSPKPQPQSQPQP
ncbi:hypothetical protein AWJ20_2142 [Sugiyamaella lignohabitans]|uniref:UPF3 domain-containing protein n=1 Tax=Sugiyamaella lignohabitans TaxID=796027 RepID=A0A167EWN2_9ASCO|nr:uncharacterized protein AWJ20_2142 [Sugiyamaella lignohabitans]ANB14545.1 hypothetical protein AWJ20_2142 [Sugiyamaella lignohabitans]